MLPFRLLFLRILLIRVFPWSITDSIIVRIGLFTARSLPSWGAWSLALLASRLGLSSFGVVDPEMVEVDLAILILRPESAPERIVGLLEMVFLRSVSWLAWMGWSPSTGRL